LTKTGIGFDARLIGALGIGRYISGLLPELATILGDRLSIIAQARDAALIRAMVGSPPQVLTVNASPYRLAEQSLLPLRLARAGLSLVHFPHYNLPLIKPARFVVTVHDLFPFEFPEIHSGPLPRAVNHLLIRNAIAGARRIITPSGATAAAIARNFPAFAAKVTAIPEAAEERFNPVRNLEAEAAWQVRLGIRPPYVLYLGQWKAYKNLPLLIEAFRMVRETHPGTQLVVAGDDARHPEVRQFAGLLPQGSAVLPGRVPDSGIPDLYRGAAVVVLPSRAEGFGLPVIEAMASGVPVVCSDLPVLREVGNGAAIFCDPGSASSFADGIRSVLDSDGMPALRRRGLEHAATFNWRRAARATVAVYEASLGRRLVGATLEEDAGSRQDQDLQVERQ
jgi:glycosyltransferase involved in cell wall biosynthesis